MIVGCYELHLYCDHPRHNWEHISEDFDDSQATYRWYLSSNPGTFGGQTYAEAARAATKAGWLVKRPSLKRLQGYALCSWHQ